MFVWQYVSMTESYKEKEIELIPVWTVRINMQL